MAPSPRTVRPLSFGSLYWALCTPTAESFSWRTLSLSAVAKQASISQQTEPRLAPVRTLIGTSPVSFPSFFFFSPLRRQGVFPLLPSAWFHSSSTSKLRARHVPYAVCAVKLPHMWQCSLWGVWHGSSGALVHRTIKDAGVTIAILKQFCFGTPDSMHVIKHLWKCEK